METIDATHHLVDSAFEAHQILAQLINTETITEDVGIGPYEYGSARGWDSQIVTYAVEEEGEATFVYNSRRTPLDVMDFDDPFPLAEVDSTRFSLEDDKILEVVINYTAAPTVIPDEDGNYVITQPLSWTLEVK